MTGLYLLSLSQSGLKTVDWHKTPTLIVGYVFFPGVLESPIIHPAVFPSRSYLNLYPLDLGCSSICTCGSSAVRL